MTKLELLFLSLTRKRCRFKSSSSAWGFKLFEINVDSLEPLTSSSYFMLLRKVTTLLTTTVQLLSTLISNYVNCHSWLTVFMFYILFINVYTRVKQKEKTETRLNSLYLMSFISSQRSHPCGFFTSGLLIS